MTTHEKGLELLERYLHETGQHLPKNLRDDVKAELRSLLMETIEERCRATGRPFDEAMVVEVVREFGKPEKVAERYQPEPGYLIGPRLFPAFKMVGTIIVVGIVGIHALIFVLTTLKAGWRFPEEIFGGSLTAQVWATLESLFRNLCLLVLVFAVIERVWKPKPGAEKEEDWKPQDLPKIEDPERISAASLVAKSYFIVLFLVVFNFFPQWFGVVYFNDSEVRAISLPAMGIHLPGTLINVWWVLALALNMWLLDARRWTRETRWAELGLGVFGIVILWMVVAQAGWAQETTEGMSLASGRLFLGLGKLVRAALAIALLIAVIENAVRAYRVVRRYGV